MEIHALYSKLLSHILPFDEKERQDISNVREWLSSGEPIFRREGADPPQHVVSYAVLINGDQILFQQHRKSGLWLTPGGHIDRDEKPLIAAKRELYEELGIRPELLPQTSVASEPFFLTVTETVGDIVPRHTDVSFWYVFSFQSKVHNLPALNIPTDEYLSLRWFSFDEVSNSIDGAFDPEIGRFVSKLQARITAV